MEMLIRKICFRLDQDTKKQAYLERWYSTMIELFYKNVERFL